MTKISREKIIRIAFSTFKVIFFKKNLVEFCHPTIEILVESSILRLIDCATKSLIKDKDVLEDIDFVGKIVEKNIKILTFLIFKIDLLKNIKKKFNLEILNGDQFTVKNFGKKMLKNLKTKIL
jgi:V-type H+-transporting ATPase subunit H